MRNVSFIATLAVFALTLAGCNNNPYPAGESTSNVLYRTLSDDPKSLDPSVTYTVDEAQVTDLIYPSYFQYHYLKRDPFVLQLNLGAKEPVREPYVFTDKHGKTVKGERYTFTIKQGLRFQDDPVFPGGKGRAITANDFIYSFKRIADPGVHSPVASFFEDKVVGWKEYAAEFEKKGKAHYDASLPGVQADPRDPYTFRVLLNQPYPQLRFLMAMHFTTPIPREAVEKYGEQFALQHPVGSGPYLMSEYRPKQRIVLIANPNRHPEFYPTEGQPGDREAGLLRDAGKQLPLAQKVVFNINKEAVTSWNLFQQGYLDAAGVGNTNYQQVIAKAGMLTEEMKRKGVQLKRDVQANIYYIAFNMKDPVVGGYTPEKRKLRQAISLAIDSQAFIDLFSQGIGRQAESIIPPGVFGYEPEYKNPYRRYDPDLTRAKQLLAEAGYPNGADKKTGQRLILNFDNSATTPAGRQLVGLVTKQIERLGVKVESRSTRSNVFQDKVNKGQFQFIRYGWFADYPDPENFVFLLYGPNKRPGPNASGYDNPEYNKLFVKMRALEDGPERLAVLRQMRAIAVEDVPWVYINHDEDLSLHYDWLLNVKSHPIANDTTKYRAVDVEKRAQMQRAWNRPNYLPLIAIAGLLVVGAIPAVSVVRQRQNRRVRRADAPEAAAAADSNNNGKASH